MHDIEAFASRYDVALTPVARPIVDHYLHHVRRYRIVGAYVCFVAGMSQVEPLIRRWPAVGAVTIALVRGGGRGHHVDIEPDSPVPAYEQLRAQIATAIAAGVLEPGRQLPSIRQIAGDWASRPARSRAPTRSSSRPGSSGGRGRGGTARSTPHAPNPKSGASSATCDRPCTRQRPLGRLGHG